MSRRRELWKAALPPLGFLISVVVLSTSGGGELGAPPLGDLSGWAERVGTTVAAVVVFRLVALAGAGWMALVSSVRLVALAAGATRLALAAERAMPPAARSALAWVGGLSAAGVVLIGTTATPASGATGDRPATERMAQLPGEDAPAPVAEPTVTMSVLPADTHAPVPDEPTVEGSASLPAAEPVATLSVLPPVAPPVLPSAPPPVAAAATPVGPHLPGPAVPAPAPVPVPAAADEWVVATGESFWSIAEEVVEERRGRPGSEAEVARYWRQLVAANGDRLVSGNADLIFPGQRFVVP